MRLQEYVDLIIEKNKEHGLDWDTTTATLAIYKYLKSPALADYYHNIELMRHDNGEPIICEIDNDLKTSPRAVGHFSYSGVSLPSLDGEDTVSYKLNRQIQKPRTNIRVGTNALQAEMVKVRDKFLKANSFSEFIQDFDLNDTEKFNKDLILESKLDYRIKKLIKLATFCSSVKGNPAYADNHVLLDMVLSLVEETAKSSSYKANGLIRPILNIMEKEDVPSYTAIDEFNKLAHFDKIDVNGYYFSGRPSDEKIAYFEKMSQMPEIKDSTIFGVVMNNPDNVVNKLADTFVFDELKKMALLQTRFAIKAPTIEKMFEKRPIVDEIYQEALHRSPILNLPMSERFQHITIKDSEYDLKGDVKLSFSSLMDNVGLYGDDDKHYYLSLQTKILAYPTGSNFIMNDQPYERSYGHDGVGPYYVTFGMERSFTNKINAFYIEKMFISPNLEDNYVAELFENLMQNCMVRQLPLIFDEPNLHNVIGKRNMEILNQVREKYSNVVPVITCNTDIVEYKAFLNKELNYSQVMSLHETFKALEKEQDGKKLNASVYTSQVEKMENTQSVDKKSLNKL